MKTSFDHLNLGCGLNAPPGWLNVDGSWQVVLARHPWLKELLVTLHLLPRIQADIPWSKDVLRLNFNRPFPFASASFHAVYSSHTLEHLYYGDAVRFLKECHRVLGRGGTCRAVVPDLRSIVSRYEKAKSANDPEAATRLMEELLVHDKQRKPGPIGIYYRLTAFHQHKWMYDAESLQKLFETAGFAQVRQAAYLDSKIARIHEVEDRGRIADGQGVAVEGTKE
jgi:predicted SAM-dependent methyltransferase